MVDVRIPILYSMNEDTNFSEKSVALQIAEALQLIVQISRFPDGSRKITHISYVDGLTQNDKVNVRDIFIYNRKTKSFQYTGYYPKALIRSVREKGLDFDDSIFQKQKDSSAPVRQPVAKGE